MRPEIGVLDGYQHLIVAKKQRERLTSRLPACNCRSAGAHCPACANRCR
jgi:hypothetical protein